MFPMEAHEKKFYPRKKIFKNNVITELIIFIKRETVCIYEPKIKSVRIAYR